MGIRFLKHATAVTVPVGQFVSSTDAKTLFTTTMLTRSAIKCCLFKGATPSNITLSTSSGPNTLAATTKSKGTFLLAFTTGNVDTVGNFRVTFESTQKFLPFHEDFVIEEESVHSALHASGGNIAASTAIAEACENSVITGTLTRRQLGKIMAAKTVGKVTGGATTEITYRNIADNTDVIIETVDASGNRTAVTLDLTT